MTAKESAAIFDVNVVFKFVAKDWIRLKEGKCFHLFSKPPNPRYSIRIFGLRTLHFAEKCEIVLPQK
jgi:hypothetical protein